MQLPTEVFGNVCVVHTPDELAMDQAEDFGQFLRQLEVCNVVLDIDNTETIDSAGLTAFLDGRDELMSRGGDLKVSATEDSTNRKILEITRLDCQLDVFDSVIDAVKSFR